MFRLGYVRNNRVYKSVIRPARYQGTYSGARWHAWPVNDTGMIPNDAYGSDVACAGFWRHQKQTNSPVVGKGGNPTEAYRNLVKAMKNKDLDSLDAVKESDYMKAYRDE